MHANRSRVRRVIAQNKGVPNLSEHNYVTATKEYLINSNNLLKYFNFIFFQQQSLKISFKLVIFVIEIAKKEKGCVIYLNTVLL